MPDNETLPNFTGENTLVKGEFGFPEKVKRKPIRIIRLAGIKFLIAGKHLSLQVSEVRAMEWSEKEQQVIVIDVDGKEYKTGVTDPFAMDLILNRPEDDGLEEGEGSETKRNKHFGLHRDEDKHQKPKDQMRRKRRRR